MSYEIGQEVWAIGADFSVRNGPIARLRFGTTHPIFVVLGSIAFGYEERNIFPTLEAAHAEARKRAREILNAVELAAAEAMPEVTDRG